jgi:hypothetical protein
VNLLQLRLRHQTWRADSTVGTNVDVLVDGELLADFGNFATDLPFALLPSAEYDGSFEILTCTCGNAGCAGLFHPIQVAHHDGAVHWEITEPEPPRHLTFDERAYAEEISRLVDEGKRLVLEGKLKDAVPEGNQQFFDGADQMQEWIEAGRRLQLKRGMWRVPPTP